jgi:zeaxanthin glucosyltransferase
MTHFGIICPEATGHLNPMIALCHKLKQRGHRVTILGIEDSRAKISKAGLKFQLIGESDFPTGITEEFFTQLGNLSGLKALKYTLAWFDNTAKMRLRDAPAIIKAERIEALLVDQATSEGGTVAEYLDLPFVSVCNAMMLNQETSVPPFNTSWTYDTSWRGILRNKAGYALLELVGKSLTKTINEHRQQWNLKPFTNFNQRFSQLAQISQQPQEFEFPRQELPNCFHFTGPYHYANAVSQEKISFPYDKLTGQPLIYASLGTLQNRLLWVFKMIAEACSGMDVQLIITLGWGNDTGPLPEFPGNPIVVGFAPQLELLQKAVLTITHSGMNTTLHSLSYGVPMVSIPIAHEQPGIANRVAWTKTGKVIPLNKLNKEDLRNVIRQILTENIYRQNALKFQKAIKQAGGVNRAADIIEQVVSTGKPVLSPKTKAF